MHDYLGVLDYLRVPEDIRRYFEYRESVLPILQAAQTTVEEPDIMVGFLTEIDLPIPNSKERLKDFIQDVDDFDITYILNNLLGHI